MSPYVTMRAHTNLTLDFKIAIDILHVQIGMIETRHKQPMDYSKNAILVTPSNV